MTPIQQKFAAHCAVACLAMFLGIKYEDVLRHVSGHELTLGGLTNSGSHLGCGVSIPSFDGADLLHKLANEASIHPGLP